MPFRRMPGVSSAAGTTRGPLAVPGGSSGTEGGQTGGGGGRASAEKSAFTGDRIDGGPGDCKVVSPGGAMQAPEGAADGSRGPLVAAEAAEDPAHDPSPPAVVAAEAGQALVLCDLGIPSAGRIE